MASMQWASLFTRRPLSFYICYNILQVMHPIRSIKEKVGSAVEDIAITAPQFVKDAVVAVGEKVQELNEKVLEPEQQRFADEHGYTHGGMREKAMKYVTGIGKYEAGAHFINDHVVNPMRPHQEQTGPPM